MGQVINSIRMIDETLPWLTFPAAVDLSNTIVVTPSGDIDLLCTDEQLDVWIAAERGRIACVDAASGRLPDVRALRADLRALLYAYAEGRTLPDRPRRRINTLSATAPAYPVATTRGGTAVRHASQDPYAIFAADVARSAIELIGSDDQTLSVCTAPSCGLLYPPDHPQQLWCCKACGNRARVARHAARQRTRRPSPAPSHTTPHPPR
jgi:predicted RNA-binding Zn ribbon-like protein